MNCCNRREGFGNVRRPRREGFGNCTGCVVRREGFGNVRRPRRVVRREGFGNVRRPCRVVRREGFGNVRRPCRGVRREGFGEWTCSPGEGCDGGKGDDYDTCMSRCNGPGDGCLNCDYAECSYNCPVDPDSDARWDCLQSCEAACTNSCSSLF
jgi:hypothetical protein